MVIVLVTAKPDEEPHPRVLFAETKRGNGPCRALWKCKVTAQVENWKNGVKRRPAESELSNKTRPGPLGLAILWNLNFHHAVPIEFNLDGHRETGLR